MQEVQRFSDVSELNKLQQEEVGKMKAMVWNFFVKLKNLVLVSKSIFMNLSFFRMEVVNGASSLYGFSVFLKLTGNYWKAQHIALKFVLELECNKARVPS